MRNLILFTESIDLADYWWGQILIGIFIAYLLWRYVYIPLTPQSEWKCRNGFHNWGSGRRFQTCNFCQAEREDLAETHDLVQPWDEVGDSSWLIIKPGKFSKKKGERL